MVTLDESPGSVRALPLATRLAERAGIPIEIIGTPDAPDDASRLRGVLDTIVREAGSIIRSLRCADHEAMSIITSRARVAK